MGRQNHKTNGSSRRIHSTTRKRHRQTIPNASRRHLLNHLKTDILNIINDEILALDTADIGIPLGSLFLPEFFSGKGPAIPVHILSIRNSDATFESNFSQAGINQTLHQLNMIVSVDVSVLVMGETDSFTIHSEVVVAETVIIGDVPSTYLQTGGYYGFQREN